MKMWKALLMLLKKCNQIDPWRFFLNNFIVPLLLLTLWIIAENHNFVTVIPNIRFDAFSVSDPSQTQLYSPRMGALAVEVFAVENLFTNNHTRSHEDHGFPIEKIQQRLTQQLKDFGIRKSVGGGTDDVQVLVYRLNSTAYVSVFCQPALDTNSIFLFANLLLSNGPSLLQSRELDLVRDGSVFVMTQVAIVLADSSNVTNLPEVKIKIDDIHQRQIRSFSRDYYRLIPFVTIVLVGLRVVWLLARMQEELKDGSVVAFIAYAYPNILNTFAWLVTLVFEVILLELWIMGPLLMASCLSQTQNEFFAAKIRIDLLAFIILLYCVQEAVFVTWSICLFGKHASFFYGTITSIRLLIHMLHFYKKPLLCLDGSTSIFALLSGSYALEIGIKFATELNLPIPADTIDFMACAGKGKLDTLSYRAAVLAIIFWALFFYTGTIIVAYLPIRDGSFRPEVGTTLAGRIHCRRQTPNIDPSDVPLIQTFTKGTKLSLTMLGVTYENAEKYRVLNNFTLVIPRGQIVSLVGDVSDVGDAVLAILSGVCTKYEGLVTHCGQLADPDCLANNVSVCPVNFFLLNQMTIANNVKFFMSARNVTDAQQVFSALMKDLEMKAPLETTFEILSNSDKRKACIGIALLGLSDVVVLEEPTRDLSPEDAKKLVVLLQREARRRSVLLITTDSEFAESVSERVNVCFDGSVVFSGTVTALVSVLLDSVLVLDAEMPFTMVLHLRLPPRKNYEERQGNSNYSNLRLLDLIQTFPTGVKTIHISRQSIVLQVRGTDNQVQEVYDTLLAQQEDLNIQKITMADPSLHNALEAASDTKVTLALLGEQRQIHRNIRDKWNFCKRGLRDFGDRMSVETVLSQIQCTAYLWTLLFVRRGLLPNIMILLCILFLLDCLLFHAGHDLLMITQMHSFHKKLWGVYCNNESYLRSQNRDRILELFQDIKVPNVSSEPNQLGQVCLEITKNNTHILHAPVTNVRDLAVFLGRLYNAYFAPANRINWYYHETSHSNLIRLLANNLMALFWSSQFGYLLITTTLVTIDIYCFVCSHDFFNKARLLQAGLRKTAFWIGIITFAIIKSFTRTTLFEGIAGILDFDDGSEVYISGRRIPLEFKHRTLIGVAHSTDRLPDQAIVEDYLNLFNTIREVPGPWQGYHLELVIRVFGLEDVRKMAIESISHSKRKLVAIASAFIGIPALIILNDPLDLVEAQDRERICNAINSLKSKDSIILVFSSSLDDALSLELDRAAVLAAGELVTIRTLPDLLSIDIGYHIIVRLNAPVVNDTKYANILRQQRDFVLKVLSAKFPYARLVLQAGALCEFHIRGKNVTCRNINEAKRTIIETLTSAQEIKIGYVSGKRRLLYLIDALTNKNHQADTI
ncbi:uncharacterized protein LOC111246188 isoform X7 [Varroa destructor]|uniref:ABC transporter domain-containing protein n=1 Tax=Varroa destructor TaxID=109461 RepID=A0A7M7JFQ9_VARDE|nr:uncharacterized protein LOC111246188 isoform X7 [Varroa destructor]